MKCQSHSTVDPDPYDAGAELGDAVASIEPHAVILFSSINYDLAELRTGLRDALGNPDVIIFGGTGDGAYNRERVISHGASALAIHAEGVSFTLARCGGADSDPQGAGRACATSLLEAANRAQSGVGPPDEMPVRLAFLLSDLCVDGAAMVAGVREVLDVPLVGGLVGDDWTFKQGHMVIGDEVCERSVGMLGLSGKFEFASHTASGWQPIGRPGVVSGAEGRTVYSVNGQRTFDFIADQTGLPPVGLDLGVVAMGVAVADGATANGDGRGSGRTFLRSPVRLDANSGAIEYFSAIPVGTTVQVCMADKDQVLAGAEQVASGLEQLSFSPAGIIAVSCSGRKVILGSQIDEELHGIQSAIADDVPLTGFASFGEIGPFRTGCNGSVAHTPSYFHNVSLVCLALGPADEVENC